MATVVAAVIKWGVLARISVKWRLDPWPRGSTVSWSPLCVDIPWDFWYLVPLLILFFSKTAKPFSLCQYWNMGGGHLMERYINAYLVTDLLHACSTWNLCLCHKMPRNSVYPIWVFWIKVWKWWAKSARVQVMYLSGTWSNIYCHW